MRNIARNVLRHGLDRPASSKTGHFVLVDVLPEKVIIPAAAGLLVAEPQCVSHMAPDIITPTINLALLLCNTGHV